MRRMAYVTCALAGLMAAPVALTAARADDYRGGVNGDIRQDRRDIRKDERNIERDQAREHREMREGDVAGAARAQRQEQRDQMQLQRDRQDLARDRADRR